MKPLKVTLIGPFPPPYGGISVHVKRLKNRLETDGILDCLYSQSTEIPVEAGIIQTKDRVGGKRWILSNIHKIKGPIIHSHCGWIFSPSLVLLRCFRKKIIITVHDQMTYSKWDHSRAFTKLVSKLLIKDKSVFWIAVSTSVENQLIQLGVRAENITVIPAYLPNFTGSSNSLPKPLVDFIESHSPILSIYGWRVFFLDGKDGYGFDLAFAAIEVLRNKYPSIGLICLVPTLEEKSDIKYFQSLIKRHGLESNVFLLDKALDDGQLIWKESDVYIRPSRTDGDSMSVREALSIGIPVVASNASPRPEGVILFETGDVEDLVSKIYPIINSQLSKLPGVTLPTSDEFYQQILSAYQNVFRG